MPGRPGPLGDGQGVLERRERLVRPPPRGRHVPQDGQRVPPIQGVGSVVGDAEELRRQCRGSTVVAVLVREPCGSPQCAATLRRSSSSVNAQRAVEPRSTFGERTLEPPEHPQGSGEPQGKVGIGRRQRPIERATEIVNVLTQRITPARLLRSSEVRLRLLCQRRKESRVTAARGRLLSGLHQPLAGVVADRVEELPTRAGSVVLDRDKAVLDERSEGFEQVLARLLIDSHDRLGRCERPPPTEARDAPEHGTLLWRQKIVTPIDRRPHRPLPRRQIAITAGKQPERPVELRTERGERHVPDPRGCQLEGERETAQPRADLRDDRPCDLVDLEVRSGGAGSLEKQMFSRVEGRIGLAMTDRQRAERQLALASQPQRRPAGGQDLQVGHLVQQCSDLARGVDHRLEAVEDHDGGSTPKVARQPWSADGSPVRQPESHGHGRQEESRIPQGREGHEEHGPRLADETGTHLRGEAALADAAWTGDRHEPVVRRAEPGADRSNFGVTPDQRGSAQDGPLVGRRGRRGRLGSGVVEGPSRYAELTASDQGLDRRRIGGFVRQRSRETSGGFRVDATPEPPLDVADRAFADTGPFGELRLRQPGRRPQAAHLLPETRHEQGLTNPGQRPTGATRWARRWPARGVTSWSDRFRRAMLRIHCGHSSTGGNQMNVEQNKALVRRYYDEVLNGGNPAILQDIAAEDYVEHDPFPGQGNGRADLEARARGILGALDPQFEIQDMIAEGDRVVVRWRSRGTHVGEFLGIPATNRAYDIAGIDIHRIVDGRMAEHWHVVDQLSQLQQLGLLPAPEGAPV